MDKIDKELDIVNFIREQKITQLALKKLFSKLEYFLLKRQRSFVVDSESSESSHDEYFQSKAALEEDYLNTPVLNSLLNGSVRLNASVNGDFNGDDSVSGPSRRGSI